MAWTMLAMLYNKRRTRCINRFLQAKRERVSLNFSKSWVTLLRYCHSYQAAMTFLNRVIPQLNLVYLTSDSCAKALDCFRKLSQDKKISVCDAISYTTVREHLNFAPCLACDQDFEKLGLTVLSEVP